MSKATVKAVTARVSAKAEMLAAKRARAIVAHSNAVAMCDAEGIKGNERKGIIAFASTAMQTDSARGRIAQVVLVNGESADYTFAAIAKAAQCALADVSRANLAYIANNVRFRRDLVGFLVSFDMSEETVSVRPYKAAQTAPRKGKGKVSPAPVAPASDAPSAA
jgi:hypothetical protein